MLSFCVQTSLTLVVSGPSALLSNLTSHCATVQILYHGLYKYKRLFFSTTGISSLLTLLLSITLRHPNEVMSSLIRLFILLTSAVGIVAARDQRWDRTPICIRAETKDFSILKKCYDTASLAVRLVAGTNGDFDRALEEAETYDDDDESDVDNYFLWYLIEGNFNGQGVFYRDTAKTLSDLSLAVIALGVAEDDSTNAALRIICPQLNLDVYRQFQLQSKTLYDTACGGLYIPSPSSSAACSTMSTTSTRSSTSLSSSGSLTLPLPSSSATSSSRNSLTTPPPGAVMTSRSPSSTTSCTTSASVSVRASAVAKRQVSGSHELDELFIFLIRKVANAIFAITLIENNQDDFECQADSYWVRSYNQLGYYGPYVQDLM